MGNDLSSIYTLVPEDDVEDPDDIVYDAGDYDDREAPSCPVCKKEYKGKTERGRSVWLAQHIRLHNVQGRMIENTCWKGWGTV